MDHRIEALEDAVEQIPPLGNSMVELKGDLEHLNARLGMELGKLNDKIEASLAMSRKELNEDLQISAKGIPQESTSVTEAGKHQHKVLTIFYSLLRLLTTLGPAEKGMYRRIGRSALF
ncbi:Hypothetical predicted protein [Olea europaea subsp. europaea]|uniref:Uncharacterized protein n=1 Tax=Olea europaea subsp. europaea TaxID=158383 RepID=A0A8S0R7J0_OLEEU|nr:Hypothetical predicted protein [Olea europaea subsp. europaea]